MLWLNLYATYLVGGTVNGFPDFFLGALSYWMFSQFEVLLDSCVSVDDLLWARGQHLVKLFSGFTAPSFPFRRYSIRWIDTDPWPRDTASSGCESPGCTWLLVDFLDGVFLIFYTALSGTAPHCRWLIMDLRIYLLRKNFGVIVKYDFISKDIERESVKISGY